MKKLRDNYLDGEKLFRKYFDMGAAASTYRLHRFAIGEQMLSPEGKEPTPMGVWKAMWRWASRKENKDTAYQIFCKYIDEHDWRLPDTSLPWDGDRQVLWNQFMLQKIKSAWQFPKKSREDKFLREHGWIS